MNMCSRVVIALCIPAGLFAVGSLVPRPSQAVVACRDSQGELTTCWGGAKGHLTFRETTDPRGARHVIRTSRAQPTDVETTGSLASAGSPEAAPLPPPRPKGLGSRV